MRSSSITHWSICGRRSQTCPRTDPSAIMEIVEPGAHGEDEAPPPRSLEPRRDPPLPQAPMEDPSPKRPRRPRANRRRRISSTGPRAADFRDARARSRGGGRTPREDVRGAGRHLGIAHQAPTIATREVPLEARRRRLRTTTTRATPSTTLPNGCIIVNLAFIGCPFGKAKVHGDLFENMREYFDEQRLPRTDEGNGTEPEALRPAN